MKPIIVITGPTAVGKTKLSVELAKKIDGEIINADSMQFYKGLDIGTAKIKESEKEGIPHHLFDICEVEDMYTVYQYQKDARQKIEEIRSRGHTPIFVGGTGLYIKAALYQYEFKEESKKDTYDDLSNEELYARVKKANPYTTIHLNNRKRLIRANQQLEEGNISTNKGNVPLYDFICIGLTTDRKTLYDKINKRVDIMFKEGLLLEVKSFYDGKICSKAIMTGIGYKELYRYFNREISLQEAIGLIQKNSRHYAKRQYTFFKHQLPVTWITINYDHFEKTIEEAIKVLEA